LDTARGVPAAGMRFELLFLGERVEMVTQGTLDDDGRSGGPLLTGEAFRPGRYRLVFHVGDYFAAVGSADARKFLDVVPLEFTVSDATMNYHVPLLVSPWSYSTYRGSWRFRVVGE